MFESEDHRVECPVWVWQAVRVCRSQGRVSCLGVASFVVAVLYWPILDLHGLEQFGQGKTWSLVEDV